MPKRRAMPVSSYVTVVHKRAPRGSGKQSVCGRYGYTTWLWVNVNCDVCLNSRTIKAAYVKSRSR